MIERILKEFFMVLSRYFSRFKIFSRIAFIRSHYNLQNGEWGRNFVEYSAALRCFVHPAPNVVFDCHW
jgi:hypothetical protein